MTRREALQQALDVIDNARKRVIETFTKDMSADELTYHLRERGILNHYIVRNDDGTAKGWHNITADVRMIRRRGEDGRTWDEPTNLGPFMPAYKVFEKTDLVRGR
jgi:hypothetical protein